MADNIQVTLEGGEELVAKLREMGIRVQDVLLPAMQAGAILVRDSASGQAPGPHIEMQTTKRTAKVVEVSVGPDRPHWYYRFFEFGTSAHGPKRARLMIWEGGAARRVSGIAARPFLRPAADSQGDAATDRVGQDFRSAVESVI